MVKEFLNLFFPESQDEHTGLNRSDSSDLVIYKIYPRDSLYISLSDYSFESYVLAYNPKLNFREEGLLRKWEIGVQLVAKFIKKSINEKILCLSFSIPKGNHLPPL